MALCTRQTIGGKVQLALCLVLSKIRILETWYYGSRIPILLQGNNKSIYENEDAHPKRTARKKATSGRRINIADDDVPEE